ncbi:MAG: biotin synthetase [Bdellovibrio sp.]|nr:MAG: biotin synthetase [Bdellovibrio sp.]
MRRQVGCCKHQYRRTDPLGSRRRLVPGLRRGGPLNIYSLTTQWAEKRKIPVHAQPSVDSTNDWAKREFDQTKDATDIYLTDHQEAGRGRGANVWVNAAPGTSLLSTWSFPLKQPPQPVAAPAIGAALFRAAKATWMDLSFSLKPPNDLQCEGQKIAGLLIESIQQGAKSRLLVGLGLNVLALPQLPLAGCLAEFLPPSRLTEVVWSSFLDRWYFEMTLSLTQLQELNDDQTSLILYAINQSSTLQTPVLEVLKDGGMVMTGGVRIGWQSI